MVRERAVESATKDPKIACQIDLRRTLEIVSLEPFLCNFQAPAFELDRLPEI